MAAALRTRHRTRRPPQTTRWTQVRTQGKFKFLWYYGVLGVGVPIAIFKVIFDILKYGPNIVVLDTILTILLLPIAGLLAGYLTWLISERRFQKRHAAAKETGQIGKVV